MSGVTEVCGDSLECLFDVGAIGNLEVGEATLNIQITYNETVEESQPSNCNPLPIPINYPIYCFESCV